MNPETALGIPKGETGTEWTIQRPEALEVMMTEFQGVVPMIAYENGPAALDWLARAFGFVETTRVMADGRLTHGEMDTGGGKIMLATPSPHYQSPSRHRSECLAARRWSEVPWIVDGVLVYVDDVDAHATQAREAGATMLSDVEEGPPGKRYRVEDAEGHRWMFMEPSHQGA